ncbi:hypothetical protein COO60DRAFT_1473913 [Scenedesmus sp. NREL 46B-D3]|nr:hypothetical protein COO60DRAFT_1473904 [Scenedesmus sp. NREL 46B-D3]KAF6266222.1 hypothetical protein COO60DRAFT_1473913 [Scenedesmus sp. NREL 46B-D3]
MIFGAVLEDVGWCHRVLLLFLSSLGMCAMHANILEQCSLLFPPRWGAGPMALMLWLEWVIIIIIILPIQAIASALNG